VTVNLKNEIKRFVFGVSDEEVQAVYNHILMAILI
jgi:hypothetical protein